MTVQPKHVQRSCRSDHQFLLCRTDQKAREGASGDLQVEIAAALIDAFPNMPTGESFLERTMASVVDAGQFDALIVRIDNGGHADDDRSRSPAEDGTRLVRAAHAVQKVCQDQGGVWGYLGEEMFGCVFSGPGAADVNGIAENIQEELKHPPQVSVTIGIARYPTIDYPKRQILDNARKALDHAAFFGPGSVTGFDAVSLNISADQYYQNGDVDGAITELTRALALDPLNVNVHNSLGVCYGVQGDFEQAAAAFDTAATIDPSDAMALYNLGLVSQMTDGDDEKTLDYFMRAYDLGKDVFEVALQTGKLCLDMGKPEQGRPFLEKAAELRPDSGIACRYLGDCYAALDMTEAALERLKKAVKLNPYDAEALSALGTMMDAVGENPEVTILFCEHSVGISPDNGLFRHRLGNLYLKQGLLEAALEAFKKARDLGCDTLPDIERTEALLNAGIEGGPRESAATN